MITVRNWGSGRNRLALQLWILRVGEGEKLQFLPPLTITFALLMCASPPPSLPTPNSAQSEPKPKSKREPKIKKQESVQVSNYHLQN